MNIDGKLPRSGNSKKLKPTDQKANLVAWMNTSERNTSFALVLTYSCVLVAAWFGGLVPEWALLAVTWVFYLLAVAMDVRYRVLLALGAASAANLAVAVASWREGRELWIAGGLTVGAFLSYVFLIGAIKRTEYLPTPREPTYARLAE